MPRREEIGRNLVAGREVHLERGGWECVTAQRAADRARRHEVRNAGLVRQPLREFVHRTRVIEVVVGRECERRLLEEIARGLVQARDAEPRVDEQRAIAAPHEPDVAARERVHMRLGEQGNTVGEGLAAKPG